MSERGFLCRGCSAGWVLQSLSVLLILSISSKEYKKGPKRIYVNKLHKHHVCLVFVVSLLVLFTGKRKRQRRRPCPERCSLFKHICTLTLSAYLLHFSPTVIGRTIPALLVLQKAIVRKVTQQRATLD